MSKDKPKSSKTGALVVVLLVLWLAGLTALVLTYLKKPTAGDLDARVAKLEAKANSLVGKVNPPGTKELNDLEARVEDLEKRIAGAAFGDTQPVAAQTDGSDGCDCEQLQDRLASLEAAVGSESGTRTVSGNRSGQTPSSDKPSDESGNTTQTAAQTRSDSTEKSTGTAKKSAAKSRSKSTARTTPPPRRPGAVSSPNARATGEAATVNQDYGARSVQDMNRRYAPIYEGSSEDASSRGLLGPGGGGFR